MFYNEKHPANIPSRRWLFWDNRNKTVFKKISFTTPGSTDDPNIQAVYMGEHGMAHSCFSEQDEASGCRVVLFSSSAMACAWDKELPPSRGWAVGRAPALAWRTFAAHREPGRSRGPWACRSPPGEEHPHRQRHPAAFLIHHTALKGLSCRHLSHRNEAFHLTCLCYCYCLFCHKIPGGTEYI